MYLATNFQYKYIHLQSTISYYFGVFPFVWDPQAKKYRSNDKALRNFNLASIICILQYVYVCVELARLKFVKNEKLSNLYLPLLTVLVMTLLNWDLYLFYFKKDEMITLLNSIRGHTDHIAINFAGTKDKDVSISKKATKFWDQNTLSNCISSSSLIVICLFHYFIYPEYNVYITHHLCKSQNVSNPFLKLLVYLLHSIVPVIVYTKINLTFCFHNNFVVEVITQYLPLIRQEFRVGLPPNSYYTSPKLRTFPTIVAEYRAFEIICKMYLDVMGILLIPGHAITLQGSLFSNVTLIRQWADLDAPSITILIAASLAFQMAWLFALHGSGLLMMYSSKTIRSWKRGEWGSKWNRRYMGKFMKTCRTIRIAYKSYFSYKRTSILSYLKGLYRGTFRALCTLKSA